LEDILAQLPAGVSAEVAAQIKINRLSIFGQGGERRPWFSQGALPRGAGLGRRGREEKQRRRENI